MAHRTFISYKYSDARDVRDRIIEALGNDASFYRGEDGFSDDLSSLKADTIKSHLKDMIYGTSVTILVLSPEMMASKWIPWEIEYSLKAVSRSGVSSHTNGIVAVTKKVNGGYSWIKTCRKNSDGCNTSVFDDNKMPAIVAANRFNQNPKVYACERCKSVDSLTGCYISIVDEDSFLDDPSRYIENAYDKSQHLSGYILTKTLG